MDTQQKRVEIKRLRDVDFIADYKSFEVDGEVCDSWEIFQMMIEKYIAEGILSPTNYAMIGIIWESVQEFVRGTHNPASEYYQG